TPPSTASPDTDPPRPNLNNPSPDPPIPLTALDPLANLTHSQKAEGLKPSRRCPDGQEADDKCRLPGQIEPSATFRHSIRHPVNNCANDKAATTEGGFDGRPTRTDTKRRGRRRSTPQPAPGQA